MAHRYVYRSHHHVFRRVWFWLLVKGGLLAAIALGFLMVSIRTDQRWWLVGALPSLVSIGLLVCQHRIQSVIIRDGNLVYCYGMFFIRQQVIPLWQLNMETRQTLFGHMFDYGRVVLHTDYGVVHIREVAEIRRFRDTIVEHQNTLMDQPASYKLIAHRAIPTR